MCFDTVTGKHAAFTAEFVYGSAAGDCFQSVNR